MTSRGGAAHTLLPESDIVRVLTLALLLTRYMTLNWTFDLQEACLKVDLQPLSGWYPKPSRLHLLPPCMGKESFSYK